MASSDGAIELFLCTRLNCWISRGACAMQFRRFQIPFWEGTDQIVDGKVERKYGRVGCACSECRLGEAHAREEKPEHWPDGRRIVLRVLGQK